MTPDHNASEIPGLSAEILARLACPACHGGLALDGEVIRCTECGRGYPIEDGIPVLIAERAISERASTVE